MPAAADIQPSPAAPPLLLVDAAADETLRRRLVDAFPGAELRAWGTDLLLPPAAEPRTLVCWLDDGALTDLLPLAVERHWTLALLPHPGLRHGRTGFGIAASLDQAVADIIGGEPASVDLLLCNGQPVLNTVVVAQGFAVSPDSSLDTSWRVRWRRARRLLRHIGALRLTPMTLTTYKEKRFDTAAFGVLALQHANSSRLSRRLLDDSSLNDGMLHVLVLAPRSVGELLRFVLASLLPWGSGRLPEFIAQIRTAALTIASSKPLEYVRDGVAISAQEVAFDVKPGALRLYCGGAIDDTPREADSKEVVRARALPLGESRNELIGHPLPLLAHAGSEEFRELFPALRESARTSGTFLILMVLSTLLAALGLFADSAPVIIGAMILAPLMAPIVSLAMGLLRQDEMLIRGSAKTLVIGILLAVGCAALLTLLTPLHTVNGEIGARLRPTLLDLGVAVVSGIAGAYAHARSEVAKSLAGVAIAVALVPPLAVSGIGIGWGDGAVFRGAFLLFFTNLAGIVLAAALTFLLLGYSAFRMARRGLAASAVLVALISIPLALGFNRMVEEHRIVRELQGFEHAGIRLREIRVIDDAPLLLAVTLVAERPMTRPQILALKRAVEARLGEPATMQVSQALLY